MASVFVKSRIISCWPQAFSHQCLSWLVYPIYLSGTLWQHIRQIWLSLYFGRMQSNQNPMLTPNEPDMLPKCTKRCDQVFTKIWGQRLDITGDQNSRESYWLANYCKGNSVYHKPVWLAVFCIKLFVSATESICLASRAANTSIRMRKSQVKIN